MMRIAFLFFLMLTICSSVSIASAESHFSFSVDLPNSVTAEEGASLSEVAISAQSEKGRLDLEVSSEQGEVFRYSLSMRNAPERFRAGHYIIDRSVGPFLPGGEQVVLSHKNSAPCSYYYVSSADILEIGYRELSNNGISEIDKLAIDVVHRCLSGTGLGKAFRASIRLDSSNITIPEEVTARSVSASSELHENYQATNVLREEGFWIGDLFQPGYQISLRQEKRLAVQELTIEWSSYLGFVPRRVTVSVLDKDEVVHKSGLGLIGQYSNGKLFSTFSIPLMRGESVAVEFPMTDNFVQNLLGDQLVFPIVSRIRVFGYAFDGSDDPPFRNRWQNSSNRFDVNGDGFVTVFDALALITDLNQSGSRALAQREFGTYSYYPDVNGDGYLDNKDVLEVINYVNSY